MCKNWALSQEKSADEGEGGKNSAADCYDSEPKLLEDDVEDKDENGPHTSAGSLYSVGKVQKGIFTSICLREGTRLLGAHSAM